MEKSKINKRGFWERYAYRQITSNGVSAKSSIHTLDSQERAELKKIKKSTIFKAAMAGALGVILLFAPYHIFGEKLFPTTDVWIPIYGNYIPIEIEYYIFSLVLLFLEIWYLTYINIKGTAALAKVCGYPPVDALKFEDNINQLINVGLEKKQTELKTLGINPFQGLTKWQVFTYQLLIRLKAMISGVLFKIFIRRILGRYAVKAVVDFAGVPVYAFWNGYAAHKVLDEAKARILAPALIHRFSIKLKKEYGENENFKTYLFDYLQSISVCKRAYHYNHYLLSHTLMTEFKVGINQNSMFYEDLFKMLEDSSEDQKVAFSKLFAFGMIIDGKLSPRETLKINDLYDRDILPYEFKQLKKWSDDFIEGKGLEDFFDFEPTFKNLKERSKLDKTVTKVLNDPTGAGIDLVKGAGTLASKGVTEVGKGALKGAEGVSKGVGKAGKEVLKGAGGVTKGVGKGVSKGLGGASKLVKGLKLNSKEEEE